MVKKPEGFQKPQSKPRKEVGLAVLSQGSGVITCNCGWSVVHPRKKVREDRAEQHALKRHGKAIWV